MEYKRGDIIKVQPIASGIEHEDDVVFKVLVPPSLHWFNETYIVEQLGGTNDGYEWEVFPRWIEEE